MSFDALVVLGCRVSEPPLSGPALRRVERAARAYREGLAPSIVVSGGRSWNGVVEADALAEALVNLGVPREVIVLERRSLTTHGNAVMTARLLSPESRQSIGIVTCDWHLRRALYCFRRAGLRVVGIEAASPPVSFGRRLVRDLREAAGWLYVRAVARGC